MNNILVPESLFIITKGRDGGEICLIGNHVISNLWLLIGQSSQEPYANQPHHMTERHQPYMPSGVGRSVENPGDLFSSFSRSPHDIYMILNAT